MALLAGGLELAPGLSEQHRESVGQLRERCTMATERLHEVIGLLREDPTPSLTPATSPSPSSCAGSSSRARR